MINRTNSGSWEEVEKRPLVWAIAIGFILVLIMWRLMRLPPVLTVAIWAVLAVIVYQLLPATQTAVRKTYAIDAVTAVSLVTSILQKKGLPYQPDGTTSFHLTENGTTILIEPDGRERCRVRISPRNRENAPLVDSLCQQLDDAFSLPGNE